MLKERDLIGLIATGLAGATPRPGDLGIGDDCAVLHVGRRSMLVTIDLMVETIHFDLSYTSPYLLGRKAVAASLSDIAAMGGTPRAIFVTLGIPRRKPASFARALVEGIHEEARAAGASVLGGDTSASSGPVLVDVAAVGDAARGGPILRRGAKPRDLIYVSGTLGGSARGLELLTAGFRPWSRRLWSKELTASVREADEKRLELLAAIAHLLPKPRLALGALLAERRLASAMIDVSDGLATDLHNLCEASGVGAEILEGSVPVHESVMWQGRAGSHSSRVASAKTARRRLSRRTLRRVLAGGEDYELLFTVPPRREASLVRMSSRLDVAITRIGRITPSRRSVVLVGPDRKRRDLPRGGYEHFHRP